MRSVYTYTTADAPIWLRLGSWWRGQDGQLRTIAYHKEWDIRVYVEVSDCACAESREAACGRDQRKEKLL